MLCPDDTFNSLSLFFITQLFYAEAFHILSSLRELVTAELAGIRWAPLKKNANGSRTGAQSRTGIPQPAPVSTAVYGY